MLTSSLQGMMFFISKNELKPSDEDHDSLLQKKEKMERGEEIPGLRDEDLFADREKRNKVEDNGDGNGNDDHEDNDDAALERKIDEVGLSARRKVEERGKEEREEDELIRLVGKEDDLSGVNSGDERKREKDKQQNSQHYLHRKGILGKGATFLWGIFTRTDNDKNREVGDDSKDDEDEDGDIDGLHSTSMMKREQTLELDATSTFRKLFAADAKHENIFLGRRSKKSAHQEEEEGENREEGNGEDQDGEEEEEEDQGAQVEDGIDDEEEGDEEEEYKKDEEEAEEEGEEGAQSKVVEKSVQKGISESSWWSRFKRRFSLQRGDISARKQRMVEKRKSLRERKRLEKINQRDELISNRRIKGKKGRRSTSNNRRLERERKGKKRRRRKGKKGSGCGRRGVCKYCNGNKTKDTSLEFEK